MAGETDPGREERSRQAPAEGASARIDTTVAHPARVYDYLLGGKDNFPPDREAAEHAIAANPQMVPGVRANRAFLAKAVHYLAAEAGIRQFLDIGTGLPSASNTHEVAQRAVPAARIVYVDNDPIVLTHARALLASTAEGRTDYIDADLRDPEMVLSEAARTLDFGQPIAVMLLAILHVIPDDDNPYGIVARLMDAVPPGSYLALSHTTADSDTEVVAESQQRINERLGPAAQWVTRTRAEVSRFFDGLDLVEPGLVELGQWRPGVGVTGLSGLGAYCGVARKP